MKAVNEAYIFSVSMDRLVHRPLGEKQTEPLNKPGDAISCGENEQFQSGADQTQPEFEPTLGILEVSS
ncbi:hypothetical protein [Paenibacillus sp. J22TS3]|uniref:hypothetical protein n=1 Tax=Paenibacillus sp. J22TS3 TaxID=2807192 RepID=UPI001B0C2C9B|nr:hypothetical protein [Paenibacillus sp. J22TS3]GIP22768.1 hypothetical protein J22TS3_30430 [Paenibacillus sp. J22TS3]